MKVLRSFFWGLLGAASFLSLWLAVPSSLFINPTAVKIDGSTVTVTRTFPLPNTLPSIFGARFKYTETVRPLDGSRDCHAPDAPPFTYTKRDSDFGRWTIEAWAGPCMGDDFLWEASWSYRLFGIIPLRPVRLSGIFEATP